MSSEAPPNKQVPNTTASERLGSNPIPLRTLANPFVGPFECSGVLAPPAQGENIADVTSRSACTSTTVCLLRQVRVRSVGMGLTRARDNTLVAGKTTLRRVGKMNLDGMVLRYPSDVLDRPYTPNSCDRDFLPVFS